MLETFYNLLHLQHFTLYKYKFSAHTPKRKRVWKIEECLSFAKFKIGLRLHISNILSRVFLKYVIESIERSSLHRFFHNIVVEGKKDFLNRSVRHVKSEQSIQFLNLCCVL